MSRYHRINEQNRLPGLAQGPMMLEDHHMLQLVGFDEHFATGGGLVRWLGRTFFTFWPAHPGTGFEDLCTRVG
jgi:hypothetical protein